jgi:hypothetical protein
LYFAVGAREPSPVRHPQDYIEAEDATCEGIQSQMTARAFALMLHYLPLTHAKHK